MFYTMCFLTISWRQWKAACQEGEAIIIVHRLKSSALVHGANCSKEIWGLNDAKLKCLFALIKVQNSTDL